MPGDLRIRCALLALGFSALTLATAPATTAAPYLPTPIGGPLLGATGIITNLPVGVPAPPTVPTLAYVVADGDTGEILAAKGAHLRWPPASALKTLTALVLMPRLDPKASYKAGDADVRIEGSKVGIVPGGTYSVRQLWQAVFLRSGNDAISSLTTMAGGAVETIRGMRAEARELGALDTTVVNPTGLDAAGQFSSAYDLALFGRAALGRPDLLSYAGTVHTVFPGKVALPPVRRATFQLWNEQKFVLRYPGAIGIKNGFTTKARNTLIGASRRNGRTVLVTLMQSPHNAWKDAAALSDWAYSYGSQVRPVGRLVAPGEVAAAASRQASPSSPAPTAAPPTDETGGTGGTGAGATTAGIARLPSLGRSPVALAGYVLASLVCIVVALRARVLLRRRRRA